MTPRHDATRRALRPPAARGWRRSRPAAAAVGLLAVAVVAVTSFAAGPPAPLTGGSRAPQAAGTSPHRSAQRSTGSGAPAGAAPGRPHLRIVAAGGRHGDLAVPAGFVTQVDAVYQGLVGALQALAQADPGALAGASQLPSPATVAADVAGLDPVELDQLYRAVHRQPHWAAVVADVEQLTTAATSPTSAGGGDGAAAAGGSTVAGGGSTVAAGPAGPPAAAPAAVADHADVVVAGLGAFGLGVAEGSFPPPEPVGSFPAAPAAYQPTAPVGPFVPTACPVGAPGGPSVAPGDSAIFAAQLTTDVATNVAADVPSTLLVVIAGEGTSIPDPAKYIAEALALAGVITLDTFNYVQQVAADCDTANRDGFLANIDNTTVNVYDLLSLVQQTVDATENSVDTVSQQLDVLQQTMDDQLTLAIEQALTAPLASVPNLAFELPAAVGGNLDSTPIGVQEVVHAAIQARLAAGAPVNAAAEQFLAMADAALTAGQYQAAYADYHQAYLQAVGA